MPVILNKPFNSATIRSLRVISWCNFIENQQRAVSFALLQLGGVLVWCKHVFRFDPLVKLFWCEQLQCQTSLLQGGAFLMGLLGSLGSIVIT